ncbi:hypothetical protein [Streptomyces avidinii]|uniref:CheY-like chemotaxis protein n=1 Tax=Streptomyces avidinii TaxID=1895 RepID=A0ABS4LG22_STRAV|nr:hypothetical protein [Streptomyces avidinii]MBP2040968.1 CheY-like chemotaxis protein [Streptomyces avidinii]GGZ05627.1 hypothetical protein GCM10010343_34240 [Streptomyces avidinii]
MPELRVVPRPDQEPLRVLMMCDHRRLAPALHQGLQTEGFATDVVQDSVTGLFPARKHPYDVVVLDLTGPAADPGPAQHRRALHQLLAQEGGHLVRAQQQRDRAGVGVPVVELSVGADFR